MKFRNFHPFLFAIAPILSLYSYNYDLVRPTYLTRPVLASLVMTAVVYLLIKWAVKNSEKSALLTSLLVFSFLTFGHILEMINQLEPEALLIRNYVMLCVVMIIAYIFIGRAIIKASKYLIEFSKLVLSVAIFLVLIPVSQISWAAVTQEKISLNNQPSSLTPTSDIENKPDVYYIVFDGYAREDLLSDMYQFDNSQFISWLEAQGFYVADSSTSNYPQTFFSIASSLNMDYVNYLAEAVGQNSDNRQPVIELMDNNKVRRMFEDQGYQSIQSTPQIAGIDDVDKHAINFGRKITLNELTGF